MPSIQKLTFSFASTSVEAFVGSDGHTAGLGQGSILSEALHGKYESYNTEQEEGNIIAIKRLTCTPGMRIFLLPTLPTRTFCNTSNSRIDSQDKHKNSRRYYIFWDGKKLILQGYTKEIKKTLSNCTC